LDNAVTDRQDDTQPQDGSADAQVHLDALREILDVINNSRDDERPVFDTLLRAANRLCGASTAVLLLGRPNDKHLKLAALQHTDDTENDASADRIVRANTPPMDMDPAVHVSARAICEGSVVHIADLAETDSYKAGIPSFKIMVEEMGQRSTLSVPLMDATGPIGAINLHRKTAGLFSESEISLIKSFATQAVIAIENVRQFREVQTRLERERASSEILEVISQSRDDEGPVFDAILSNASHLCHAPIAGLVMVDDERKTYGLRASRGAKPEFVEALEKNPPTLDPERFAAARAIVEQRIVHVDDLASPNLYGADDKHRIRTTQLEGIRTVLFVPLIWEQQSIGAIGLWRREVKPFSEDEIALIEIFAEQAVIAIENGRQFREVQERLKREAATSEVLSIISQSRDDERPVFDTILKKAAELCSANQASLQLANAERTHFGVAAYWGFKETAFQVGGSAPLDSGRPIPQVISTGCSMNIKDLSQSDHYLQEDPIITHVVDIEGIRSWLIVPLMKDKQAIGAIALSRREVKSYNEFEIALVETFAAQAVIAIENVRQFREVQERLEREAATSEILRVISQSQEDEAQVFDIILEKSVILCQADQSVLFLINAERTSMYLAAHWGHSRTEFSIGRSWPLEAAMSATEAIRSTLVQHILDFAETERYKSREEEAIQMVENEGIRTRLVVPLLRDGVAIGAIAMSRREVRAFAASEIKLAETFAAQAVIAIENVRQFKALERLNAELGERVEEQVGEIERMGRLKRFLPAAVADTVVSQGSDNLLKSHRALLGVLFCDIRGFTAFCETAEPEETIEVLQSYHEEMGALIAAHGAGVDTRAGDGIMVLFNDPLPCDDPAGDALRLGLAMRERMAELSKKWRRHGHRLGFGVVISLGYATVGMVGSAGRFDYTASGTAVNLAARLCDQAKDGEILLSPRAYTAVEDDFDAEPVGELTLKGIHAPVEVFRVLTES
jgi:GAF domain-containing protein